MHSHIVCWSVLYIFIPVSLCKLCPLPLIWRCQTFGFSGKAVELRLTMRNTGEENFEESGPMRILRPLILLSAVLLMSGPAQSADPLEKSFANPPADARPQTWWHWVNGDVTKEGITADLESMARIGIGGAQIFNVAQHDALLRHTEPPGPVQTLGPEWRALTRHAIQEAERLGLELTIHNCPGWSESGGPWVPVDQSMQKVVWSETNAKGPSSFSAKLKQPDSVRDYYRDIAVFAFPTLPDEESDSALLLPTITASVPDINGQALLDNDAGTGVEFPIPTHDQPLSIQFEFCKPVTFGTLRLVLRSDADETVYVGGRIEASDDEKTFRNIGDLDLFIVKLNTTTTISLPPTQARFVRLVMTTSNERSKFITFADIQFGAPGIPGIGRKAGFEVRGERKQASVSDGTLPPEVCIAPQRLLNLTDRLQPDGHLDWNVPDGYWTIIRMGHTSTGIQIHPAMDADRGLECDKMSRAAVEAHFNNMAGKVIADAGSLAGKSLKMVLADSWEAGCQNWTPAFITEFKKRRGYDPTPWLPTLTGRAVNSLGESERFLWDFRRTIADLIAENHYGVFQELCAKHGMLFTAEAPGIGRPTIADALQCQMFTDVPMGEFWMDGHNDSREPASAAHVFGKKIASAEAFTAYIADAKWTKAPFDFKAIGDLNFCRGINRFVLHRSAMQPRSDRSPGVTMGPWGSNFERTQTWWEQARAWMQYLQRCQYLLQQGLFVADVAFFYGEGAPNTITGREPKLPDGYSFDAINADVLLNRVRVNESGRIVLPDGMSYRLLLLPDDSRMTPAVLEKIASLVKAGGTVVGPRPVKSPSLSNQPAADAEIAKISAEVWGDCDGRDVTSHAYGKGRVLWGIPIGDILKALPPDFRSDSPTDFSFIHRRIGDTDAYFVSSQKHDPVNARLTFRAGDRLPELWHPESGMVEPAAIFSIKDGMVTVTLHFDPAGSVFVVFRKSAKGVDPVRHFARDGDDLLAPSAEQAGQLTRQPNGQLIVNATIPGHYTATTAGGKTLEANIKTLPAPTELAGPWRLAFPPNWGAPDHVNLDRLASWTEHPDDGVKHFSGTATYGIEFEWDLSRTPSALLDLGKVKEIAEVRLNGRDLGILWKPPFCTDATEALRQGLNKLEVRVTNLWPNRLIGDAGLPEKQRFTWTTYQPYQPNDPLLESGLIGPVRLIPISHTVLSEEKQPDRQFSPSPH